MKVSSVILFFLFPLVFFAQEHSISGAITDINNDPVVYANVLLLKQEQSGFINEKGTSSDENGFFKFENIEEGTYLINTSFLGYKTASQTIQLSKNEIINIVLKNDTESLDEVNITVKRPTLRKEADRLIFNVEKTALTEGNMLELLRSTPGVLVLNNSISVKNTTPTIFINDRKVHLSAAELTQLLESSSASTIKSIEVITNPPAKYDAESGAVLNIIMSKNLITGYRGRVFTNYTQGVFPRYNMGMTNFFKKNKVSFFANYSYTQNKINRENREAIRYPNESWHTDLNRNTWSKTHNFNFNFDYLIDNRNSLSLSSNMLFLPDFEYLTKGNTRILDNSQSENLNFNSKNLALDDKYNLGFDLDYLLRFENKGKLKVNIHTTFYDYNRNQNVSSNYFPSNNSNFSNAFRTDANQKTDLLTSQLDYELPLDEVSNLSIGLKSSNVKTKSNITQYDIDTNTNQETLNANNTDVYDYDESVFAAYASYDKSWDKWQFSGGIRLEQTNIDGQSISTNENNKQDYFKWFPTLSISHQLSEKTEVYTNYKRSISRPSYQSLNPFNFFLNDNTIVTGNPTLQPSFTNHFVFGTTLNNLYTIEAYYKDTDAIFFELPLQNNTNNIIVYTPTNLSGSKEYGIDFITSFDITPNWFVYFVTSFYNTEDTAIFDNQKIEMDQWSNYSVLSNDFSFLKDKSLTANFMLSYIGKNIQGFQIVDARVVTDLSVKKTIFNNKGILSLAVADLFNKQDFTVASRYFNQNNSNFHNQDNRYVKLGFSYKFGNTTLNTNERIKERKERERLEK